MQTVTGEKHRVASLSVGMAADIGGLLRALREARGLSQRELAERLGIAQAQVSQVESGKYVPTLAVLESILGELEAHLNIELDEGGMFTDSSGPNHPPAQETL